MNIRQTQRSRKINDCIEQIAQACPAMPSNIILAKWARDTLESEGFNITLEQAYYRVVDYTNKQEKLKVSGDYQRNFKAVKLMPYPATIKKSRTSFWSKLKGIFKREPQYLLSDDQLAHSDEQKYYELVEDEE